MSVEDELKEEMCALLLDTIKAMRTRIKAGDCPASVMKEAREMLKDNGINIDTAGVAETLKSLELVVKHPFPVNDGELREEDLENGTTGETESEDGTEAA